MVVLNFTGWHNGTQREVGSEMQSKTSASKLLSSPLKVFMLGVWKEYKLPVLHGRKEDQNLF